MVCLRKVKTYTPRGNNGQDKKNHRKNNTEGTLKTKNYIFQKF